MTSQQRLARMRAFFDKESAILVEDYEHFARPRESTPPSKAGRKLVEQSSQQGPRPSEKQSSDRSGG